MTDIVKQCIDARHDAFYSTYEIVDENLKKKIEDLFQKIEKFAKDINDSMEFETKFQSSPLNKEYTDLFTLVATSCKMIERKVDDNPNVKSDAEYLKDEALSDAKYIVKDLTLPARRKAREAFDSKMRDTPLGKIEQIGNMASLFKRFRKK